MEPIEKFFKCPHCLERISMILEPSNDDGAQVYIEDCEVCCNPIEISFEAKNSKISNFRFGKAYG